ncbi:3-hydroxyacyl-CoA dehydrogenase [Trichoderma harzianum]|uniref:3-hydroxyacyl-CoA dehydrogenase n=1 Tax=Trichoderma harzianum TaxID=5544 RepID=A0A0F9XSD6_TRIHA|nr:3-hydroxyacyl-CoA dehydrogenase [Trichoderma harzianum]
MLPENYSDRPVAVLGGGVLGRRIACTWASAGYDVQIREPDQSQHESCLNYIKENVAKYPAAGNTAAGTVRISRDLEMAVQTAWLVIEAVPEKLQIKIDTFSELETHAPKDAILASNSSSYKSSEMLGKVKDTTKSRVLNTHYYMPPENMVVELMTDAVGLDTVALIEDHYIKERQLSPTYTVDFLRREYLDKGRLGAKSPHGGLYPPQPKSIS